MKNYIKKFNEAKYNLEEVTRLFSERSNRLEFALNNFISSAQSIFWILNKEFKIKNGYDEWIKNRSERLPLESKIFKELRNISLKEYPIELGGMMISYEVLSEIPPFAQFIGPTFDTVNRIFLSNKGIIITQDGREYGVDLKFNYDFLVIAISNSKEYKIENFIAKSVIYLEAIKSEIDKTEVLFK